jgi:alanine racemase
MIVSSEEYQQCLSDFNTNPLIHIECVMSHFACADECNHPMNQAQLETFNTITDNKNNRSMANSAAILSLPYPLIRDLPIDAMRH